MSTYPGNVSLSNAVKERVVSTFQQALTLFKQGRTDEVVQGCTLILRMDPIFDPAKKLMEKARNPASPIDVDALARQLTADPMAEAKAALAARNFQRVVDITTEVLTNDLMNDEARLLNEQAREKLEAAPFVDQFIKKAEQAIASGDVNAARADLDKIRTLDGDDTAIARLESQISGVKPSAPSSSFVVETPAAPPGRGKAQASDFGFTFEEEKSQQSSLGSFSFDSPFSTDTGTVPSITPPANYDAPKKPAPPAQPTGGAFSFDTPPPSPAFGGGFSFDSPSPTATPTSSSPVSAEFDFTTASVETTPDDQKKIQQYLADGDHAFDAGDYQTAIDLWSRIFLIDVTNDQASERIEKAKTKRKDSEQQTERLLAAGIQAFDRGDANGAREKFTQLLQIDPKNTAAQEYIERLNQGAAEGETGFASQYIPPANVSHADIFADAPTSEDSVIPPTAPAAPRKAPAAAPRQAVKARAAAPSQGMPMRAILIVLVLVVVAAGAWFAWSKFKSRPKHDPVATEAIFTQAASLAQKGQFDAAIAALQDVKADDPQHDKALQMMADLQTKKSQASEVIAGRPTAAGYQEALAAGKAAFDARDYDTAKKQFDTAAHVKPLPPDMKALYDTAAQQVAKLEGAKTLFKEQRYQDALTNLQSLEQQDPQNQSIKRLITDAHFNLGAVALQEDRLDDAAREFDAVLKMDPSDELARRSKGLAERYNGQPKDLLYKIYVKYLPMRKVT